QPQKKRMTICDRSTISKILKEKEKWLSIQLTEPEEKKKVNRSAKFINLENAIAIWSKRRESESVPVEDLADQR
ncbi:14837_t:CDS:2, partial [Racocetra fulgida]